MTDHNAEGGKKVEACAWCGKPQILRFRPAVVIPICDCFATDDNDTAWSLESWNDLQRRILAQRRKDFEAGRHVEVNPLNGQSLSTFDDYLASEKK